MGRFAFCGQVWCLAIWVLFFSVFVPSTLFQVWLPPSNFEVAFNLLRPSQPWQNWAATTKCHPASFSSPSSESEIIGQIKHLRLGQQKLKVVGASHSWAPLICSGEDDTNHFSNSSHIHLLSLENFNQVVSVDNQHNTITVQAGMRVKELVKVLRRNNRALEFVPSYDQLTVGGMISTGAHASSRSHSSFSSLIQEFRLITADSSIRTIKSSDPLFKTAGISLGLFGVISTVTLKTVPLYSLSLQIAPMSFDQFFSHLTSSNSSVLGTWVPYTSSIFSLTITPSSPSSSSSSFNLFTTIIEYFIRFGTLILWVLLETETIFSEKTSIYLHQHFLHPLILATSSITLHGASWEEGFLKEEPHRLCANAEWFLQLKHCRQAFNRFVEEVDKVKKSVEEDKLPWGGGFFSGLLPIRVLKGEEFIMSVAPKEESEEWCAIDVHLVSQYKIERAEVERIAEEVFEGEFSGRRHWGKELGRVTTTALRKNFRHLDEFLKVRSELDPEGMFLNNYFARILNITQH